MPNAKQNARRGRWEKTRLFLHLLRALGSLCLVAEGEEILRLKGMECQVSLETWGLSLHLIQDENHSKAEGCSGHGNSTQFSRCETTYTMCCSTVLVECDLKKTTAGTMISHRAVMLLWKLLLEHRYIWTTEVKPWCTPVFYSIFWLTSHDVPLFTDGRVCVSVSCLSTLRHRLVVPQTQTFYFAIYPAAFATGYFANEVHAAVLNYCGWLAL